jgi:hypothetical protein
VSSEVLQKVRQYVKEHGFGPKTPALSSDLSPEIFRAHYYDKKTLVKFCRSHNIPSHGLKNELNRRVELFLKTGEVSEEKPARSAGLPDSQLGLTLDRQVVNYKSDPATRLFFKKHIPEFAGFSAYVQKWLKERLAKGDVLTYAEVIAEHKRFLQEKSAAKSTGMPGQVTHDSCQFNQFLIDYSHDHGPKAHSSKEAWRLVRDFAGDKTYARYKEEIRKIMAFIGK